MNDLLNTMLNRYHRMNFAKSYILGFEYHGVIYMAFATKAALKISSKLEKGGRDCGMAIRFRPTNFHKKNLMKKAEAICSKKFFEEMVKNSRYNRGEIFEKLVTERFEQKWKKDTTPFTQAGDIEINGIEYQIKFQSATICTEQTLMNLRR